MIVACETKKWKIKDEKNIYIEEKESKQYEMNWKAKCRKEVIIVVALLSPLPYWMHSHNFHAHNSDSENKKCARHIVCAITKTRKKESLLHINPALEKLQKRDVKKTDERLCTAIVWNANTKMQAKWNANENEVIFYFIQQQRKSTIVSIVRIGRAAIVIIVSFMYTSDIGQHLSIQCFLLLFLNRKKYASDDWS